MESLSIWHWMLVFIAAPAIGILSMLPIIISLLRNNVNTLKIAILQGVLGWTVVGWIAALIWAFSGKTKV